MFKSLIGQLNGIKLLIFDINGVLDNLIGTKIELGKKVFNLQGQELAEFIVGIDRIYELNKSESLENIVIKSLEQTKKSFTLAQVNEFCGQYYSHNKIDQRITEELNMLSKTNMICLYTSLRIKYLNQMNGLELLNKEIKFFSGEEFVEEKPSVRNLLIICEHFGVSPNQTAYFGDNIVVDLMPAKLLGMKTILVSNYVDSLVDFGIQEL